MSEIAGRLSVLVGGYFLAKHFGGSGTLLGGGSAGCCWAHSTGLWM